MLNMNYKLKALGLTSFFTDMASAMITPILPIYVLQILNQDVGQLGYIVAITTFCSYFLRFLSGYVSNRFGLTRSLVIGGYTISALAKPLLAVTSTWYHVAALRGLERLGKAFRSAPKDEIVSRLGEKKAAGKTFGIQKAFDLSGSILGAGIVTCLLLVADADVDFFRFIFLFTAFPGLLAVITIVIALKNAPIEEIKKREPFFTKDSFQLIPLLAFASALSLFTLNEALVIVRAQEVGLSLRLIPGLLVLTKIISLLLSIRMGMWMDKVGYFGAFRLAFLISGVNLMLLLLPWSFSTAVVLAAYGLNQLFLIHSLRVAISRLQSNQSTFFGVLHTFTALTSSIGVLVFTQIWQRWNSVTAISIGLVGIVILFAGVTVYNAIN
jgi:MFS family permease